MVDRVQFTAEGFSKSCSLCHFQAPPHRNNSHLGVASAMSCYPGNSYWVLILRGKVIVPMQLRKANITWTFLNRYQSFETLVVKKPDATLDVFDVVNVLTCSTQPLIVYWRYSTISKDSIRYHPMHCNF